MWPRGQAVKTAASHAVNVGSIPAGVTKKKSLTGTGRCSIIYAVKKEKSQRGSLVVFFLKGRIVGVDYCEGPPVPIPNTEVKLVCADDSVWVTACENR